MSPTEQSPAAAGRPRTRSAVRTAVLAALALAMVAYSALVLAAAAGVYRASFADAADPTAADAGAPGATQPADSGVPASFVTRSGRSMLVDGAPFRFTGFNLYNAAASDLYSCPSAPRLDDAQLDAAMSQVSDAGGTVVRFWAFQSYTRGGTDFSGVDRVLAAARAHGLKVMPVLENQWRDCSRPRVGPLSEVRDGTWFTTGYRAPLPGQRLSFRDYAERITHHYRDDPTVFAWSLMNEAETTRVTDDGTSELVGFARDVSEVVRAADPHHLITLGTQSNGAPGASGADFSDVYGLPGLDFAEVHDWANRGSDDQPMPGASSTSALPTPDRCQSNAAPLACSFALARELDKPIVVGEAGIAADDPQSRDTRAAQLAAKIDAAFRAGASGYLIWQLNQENTDGYGVITGSQDPIFSMLRETRRLWFPDQRTGVSPPTGRVAQ